MEELKNLVMSMPTSTPTQDDPRAQKMGIRQSGNACYVVSTIVMEGDKVLLIQEANPGIKGLWYLPAGLIDPNETIATAAKREVQEEAGVNVELDALIAVECSSSEWVRFTFTGHIVGGALKTLEKADKESLQAQWFTFDEQHLPRLRGDDILRLIQLASKWYAGCRSGCAPHRTLPAHIGHGNSSIRIVGVYRDESSRLSVLTLKSAFKSTSYPVCFFGNQYPEMAVAETLKVCGYEDPLIVKGVLSVEHLGSNSLDGLCISLLVVITTNKLRLLSDCKWTPVEGEVADRLNSILANELGCTLLWTAE